jgi:hypothetical protein
MQIRIPEHINRLCQESRWCYVYERYNAAIVLSRAIIETILKNKLGYKVDSFKKLFYLIRDAKKRTIISKKVADGAHCIRELANNIVHQGNSAIEKEKGKCALKETDKCTLKIRSKGTLEGWAECRLKEKAKCTLDFILVFLEKIYLKSNKKI